MQGKRAFAIIISKRKEVSSTNSNGNENLKNGIDNLYKAKSGGKANPVAASKLQKGITLAKQLVNAGCVEGIEYDNPNEELTLHGCILSSDTDPVFDGNNLTTLSQCLSQFDEVTFINNGEGVDISMIIHGVYKEP